MLLRQVVFVAKEWWSKSVWSFSRLPITIPNRFPTNNNSVRHQTAGAVCELIKDSKLERQKMREERDKITKRSTINWFFGIFFKPSFSTCFCLFSYLKCKFPPKYLLMIPAWRVGHTTHRKDSPKTFIFKIVNLIFSFWQNYVIFCQVCGQCDSEDERLNEKTNDDKRVKKTKNHFTYLAHNFISLCCCCGRMRNIVCCCCSLCDFGRKWNSPCLEIIDSHNKSSHKSQNYQLALTLCSCNFTQCFATWIMVQNDFRRQWDSSCISNDTVINHKW